MMNNPLVTVAIPTFNRKDTLERTLNSAICQTYKNLDILISDNHSNDETQEMCLEYEAKDSRIRYYRHDKNYGMGYQNNFMLENAMGKYYLGVCDDDYISQNYVECCIRILKNKKSNYFTYGTVNMINENNEIIHKCNTFFAKQDTPLERMKQYARTGISAMLAAAFMDIEEYKKACSNYLKNRFCEDQIAIMKILFLKKCECSDEAFYYKLNNGCTKDLATLKKTYNLPDYLDNDNWMDYLAQEHKEAILNDEFYLERLTDKKRNILANAIYEEIKNVNAQQKLNK